MSRAVDVERAYTRGAERLANREPIGGPHTDFLLPYILAAARGTTVAPVYSELTDAERLAMRILLDAIEHHSDPKSRYARYRWRISALECELVGLTTAPLDRSWTGGFTRAAARQLQRCVDAALPIVTTLQDEGLPPPGIPPVSVTITDFTWLDANPDPDLWHRIVGGGGLNPDTEATEAFLAWLVEHPQCDRATAALLFAEATPAQPLAQRIADRCTRGDGYPRSELTLSEFGHPDDEVLPPLPSLSGPGRRTRTPYVFHSEIMIETGVSWSPEPV